MCPISIQKYVRGRGIVATTFCAVALSALCNLLHGTALVATILRWPLDLKNKVVQHSTMHKRGQQIDLWQMAGFEPTDVTATHKFNTSHAGSLQTWPTVHSSQDLDVEKNIILKGIIKILCRSQWPRGLRRRSAAARLLRLWVRIPPGA